MITQLGLPTFNTDTQQPYYFLADLDELP